MRFAPILGLALIITLLAACSEPQDPTQTSNPTEIQYREVIVNQPRSLDVTIDAQGFSRTTFRDIVGMSAVFTTEIPVTLRCDSLGIERQLVPGDRAVITMAQRGTAEIICEGCPDENKMFLLDAENVPIQNTELKKIE